jgi:type VI secretion system secreted protein VgrG
VQGKKLVVKGEGPIQVEGKKLHVKSENAVNVEASGKIKVKGSQVGIN